MTWIKSQTKKTQRKRIVKFLCLLDIYYFDPYSLHFPPDDFFSGSNASTMSQKTL